MRSVPALVLALALVPSLAPADRIPFDDLYSPKARWKASATAFSPDGETLAMFWRDGEQKTLRALRSADGGTLFEVPFGDLKPEGEADSISPGSLTWSPTGDALLIEADDDLFLFDVGAKKLRRLTRTEAEEEHATLAEDGTRVAYSRSGDLYVLEIETGSEVRLTQDGKEDEIVSGTTDWVYWEEIWGRRADAIWWSPEGGRIAFYRFDDREVGRYPLVDPLPPYPSVRWQRYPKAGSTNPRVQIGVAEAATGTVAYLDTGDPDAYLARVHWSPDGKRLAVERLNRDQTRLDLLACDPERLSCVVWASQTASTWVNLNDDFRFLPDGGFLWSAEDEGWRRLYRYDSLGRRQVAVTPQGWTHDQLEGVYDQGRFLIATAHRSEGLGAAQRQVLRTDLERLETRPIGDGDGWHSAEVDPIGRYWLHTWSDRDTPQRKTVEKTDGALAFELPGAPEYAFDVTTLPTTELLAIPGPNGSRLPAMLTKPSGFDAKKKYPVLMFHYGGPGSQVVTNAWPRSLWLKWMADRGYVVFMVDNEASTFFGKKGEDRVHRNMGPLELAGQLAGVEFLRTQAYADTSRIGLYGWSGGGTNTLYSLFHSPGTWRAGVAGAPVTDWRYYDSIWTERYMDTPEDNAEGYEKSSVVSAAASLGDHLLLVHGTGDDNVHPQNSLALADKLIAAGKPFEDAFYPKQKHGFAPPQSKHFTRRMTDFFDRYLKP
ncbi:MAG: DPP IV N-terminal domain-containing protein [Acidobacteria bacterium]|nr:DPP IV N-terminal domain-containing protein [Acidobacteriota bacterium]